MKVVGKRVWDATGTRTSSSYIPNPIKLRSHTWTQRAFSTGEYRRDRSTVDKPQFQRFFMPTFRPSSHGSWCDKELTLVFCYEICATDGRLTSCRLKCATLCGYPAFSGFYEDFLQDGGAELAQMFLGHCKFAWAESRLLAVVRARSALHFQRH